MKGVVFKMKKLLSVALVLCMLLTLGISAFAYEINTDDGIIDAGQIFGDPYVYFDDTDVSVEVGKEITVDVLLNKNPGFTSLTFKVTSDDVELSAAANGDYGTAALNGNTVTVTASEAVVANGCIAKITLKGVAANDAGTVTFDLTAMVNGETAVTELSGSTCNIKVTGSAFTLGDVNGDGEIDTVDLSDMKLYLAGSLEDGKTFNVDAANFNPEEGSAIDTVDLSALKLLLAGA